MHVMLIHGQGRTPLSMSILGWRLSQKQHNVHYFGYATYLQTFDSITRRFARTIRDEIGDAPYAIVSHSLGGIIARAVLPELASHPPQHLVMLAPPNQPARIAKIMRPNPLYWWITWDCGRKLADDAFYDTLPLPTVPTTIIAGTRGVDGLLQQAIFGTETVNDSILSAQETGLGEGYEVILVPATHAFIMNSKEVAATVLEILGNGHWPTENARA
ncbi:MAG: alpha/beta hydrolase [Anaerolineae bacterium]|nr:alpha/beta hydrolase [Anaerolineae bacterium]